MLSADLNGRVALVTGASSGLGRHFAGLLARNGARVAVAARRAERLGDLAAELRAQGATALPVAMDVTDGRSIEAAMGEIEAGLGPLDLLVNNAGISGPSRRAIELEPADFASVVETDLVGAFAVARRAAQGMIAAGRGGSIVNIASILGLRVTVGVAAYEAAKAGLVQLTKALALEWARHGIRVNALAPGYILTDLNRDFFESEPGRAIIGRIPARRLGQLDDLDGPLLLLASDASRYMTGAVIPVDGGHLVSAL
jgi:NAD(P)-dependent dehydrogenase (short-subunit alcohol dehydrogenase family)